jgi:hypothetical protein
MDKEEVVNKFIELVSCKLLPEEWLNWWDKNKDNLTRILNSTEYLKIKPYKHDIIWVTMFKSQSGAIKYLEENNISYIKGNIYHENFVKEMDNFIKNKDKQNKLLLEKLKNELPELNRKYPKFFNSLRNNYSEDNCIKMETKKPFEENDNIFERLPSGIIEFFENIEKIILEGIKIDKKGLHFIVINGKEYCVFGEYWKYADGDLLLLDLDEKDDPEKIYYYAHEENKIKLLCRNIFELIEKEFVNYNKTK